MIEVYVHALNFDSVDTISIDGPKFIDHSGTVVVKATVRKWNGLRVLWEIEEQDFTFYKSGCGSSKEYTELIKELFKND